MVETPPAEDGVPQAANRRRLLILVLLSTLLALTLALRLWSLNQAPPWLWWDEATQGLDARDLLHGHFQVFFPSAQGKEPLYVYLTTPFVAAWDGQPFAVRLAGALLGVLMVPAFWVAGRALWWRRPQLGAWAGLVAAGFWAASFWPQSINRIGFQVNSFPLVLTLAVVTWLNWTHRPSRRRALVFGALAGLTLATYLAARITPVLWPALYLALPRAERRRLHATIGWAVLAFALVAAPLALYYLLQPTNALERVSMFANLYEAGTLRDQLALLIDSAWSVLGGFLGWAGDPIPRHNLPNRPPFDPVTATLFGLGLLVALIVVAGPLRRRPAARQRAWTLLCWWGILCLPAVFGANSNPHFPRLLGALPPALLLAAWPVAIAAGWLRSRARWAMWALAGLLAVIVVVQSRQTALAYFGDWARSEQLYTWYQGDMWTIGRQIAARPGTIGVLPADPSSVDGLTYMHRDLPIWQVQAGDELPAALDARLGKAGGANVMTTQWGEEPYVFADPQAAVPFFLEREGQPAGQQSYKGFDLLSFHLGPHPQFTAAGQPATVQATFAPGVTLEGARWGAAYPNAERSAPTAAAGTPFWVILNWHLDRPQTHLRVALDLVDASGHRIASSEAPLVNESSQPLVWQPDEVWHTYHLVKAPATQPPGPVRLAARLYDVESGAPLLPEQTGSVTGVNLGDASVAVSPAPPSEEPIRVDRPINAQLGNGLTLVGLATPPAAVAPGQVLSLQLFWRGGSGNYPSRPMSLTVGPGTASTPLALPAGVPAGQVFHTFADIRLPATAPEGPQTIRLVSDEGPGVDLATVKVAGRARQFAAPEVEQMVTATFGSAVQLLGIDATPVLDVDAGKPVTITLVWRALAGRQEDLTRFVHVLGSNGHPLAQHDSALCEGDCAASSWLPGEIIVDPVRVEIPDGAPEGEYRVATGWVDASSQQRLDARDGQGQRPADDLLPLPVRIRIKHAAGQEPARSSP